MSAWVFRTFYTRERLPLMTLYKSLVRPLLEYASALWSPTAKADIDKLEAIQKSFIRKINGVSRDYRTALKQLNLYSLQRRRERYQIIQVWKMLEKLAPNKSNTDELILNLQTDINHRRGRTCLSHNLARTPSYLLQAREQSIKCFGVHLFNKLPKRIRNITNVSVDAFKNQLDKHIKTIEDPASLSQTQQHWLYASTPATVYVETPPSPHLLQRDVEQTTASLSIYPVAEASIEPVSGPQAQQPTTQTF